MSEERSESRDSRGRSQRPRRPGGGRRRFSRKPKVCTFCAEKKNSLDYKDVDLLRRYVNEVGKIRPRRDTGACAKHQRMVAGAVKRARHMALLPFASERFR